MDSSVKTLLYGTSFSITVIKKDIVLVSRTLDPSYIHIKRENIKQSDLQNYTRKGLLWQAHSPEGVLKNWVGYGCPARGFNHHPITEPEKTKICNLCLKHLFLEGPFFKTNQYFLPCKLGCISTFLTPDR